MAELELLLSAAEIVLRLRDKGEHWIRNDRLWCERRFSELGALGRDRNDNRVGLPKARSARHDKWKQR
jgi:hypothetical protein